MGKTYKDTANYYSRKKPNKLAPKKVQDKIDLLELDPNNGLRNGKDRKSAAKSKVQERRRERIKSKRTDVDLNYTFRK